MGPVCNSLMYLFFFFYRLLAPYDLLMTNSLWLNAHVGVGLYMYTRQHMVTAPVYKKILFSSFGTVAFNFGSVLIWASVKSLLPENTSLRVLVGIASSAAFLYLGKEYLDHVDRIITIDTGTVEVEEKPAVAEDKWEENKRGIYALKIMFKSNSRMFDYYSSWKV